jgi:hypothetical protein
VKLSAKTCARSSQDFVSLLQRFFAEARRDGGCGRQRHQVVRARVKPVFDAVTAYLDQLKAGVLRADVDVRHFCVDAMSMVGFPMMERQLLAALARRSNEAGWLETARHENRGTLLRSSF